MGETMKYETQLKQMHGFTHYFEKESITMTIFFTDIT